MKKDFLLWNKLNNILDNSYKELHNILTEIEKTDSKLLLKSLFVYGISTFENVMTDTLRYFILAFPEKIPEKSMEVTKNQLLNEMDHLKDKFVDNTINKLSYSSLEKFIESFSKILSIEQIPKEKLDILIEIKETRNLIIHNNLKVNTLYLSKCKQTCVRANENQINEELPFDKKYAYNSIDNCSYILYENFYKPLKEKYSSYTKIKAMKTIWDYIFHSPILKFDDYWEYDQEGRLLSFKLPISLLNSRLRGGYSHTEKILFSYIYMHYAGSLHGLKNINIDIFDPKLLYGDRKIKFLYLQDILLRYPTLFSQDL